MKEIELINQIRTLIGDDRLDAAIKTLSANTKDSEKINELILQQARHKRLKKEVADGTLSIDDAKKELNALRRNLLEILEPEEPKDKPTLETPDRGIKDFKDIMEMSLTRMKVASVFIACHTSNTPVTIAEIMTFSKLKSRKMVIDFLNELALFNLLDKKRENKSTFWMINQKGKELLEILVLSEK